MDLPQPTLPTAQPQTRLRFGLFEVDLEQRVLTKRGVPVRLQDQPFQVLGLLVQSPGAVVTRDELRQKLWPDGTFVEFDDGLNTAVKKLRNALGDSAENPRFIETIPRQGYRFVAPVIAEVPAAQTQPTAAQTIAPDLVVATRERSSIVIERSSRSALWTWGAITAAIVIGVTVGGYFYRAERSSKSEPTPEATLNGSEKIRPSIAVLGFRNLSRAQEDAWLSTALSEMLNTELAAGQRLRLVPGEDISRSKLELSLVETEALAKESLERLRASLGADYVVLGSYTAVGEKGKKRIRLDLRLQDTRAGETIHEDAVGGSQDDLFELVSEAGTRLRQQLQQGPPGAEDSVRVRASMPRSVKAARLYAEGLNKLREFDAVGARDLLQKAVAEDPSFPMAHSALASAWSALGYESKAKQEAKVAFDLSGHLSSEEQMLAEARYREVSREWPRAIEIYSGLWKSFPDNLEYGLRLARAQSSDGHPNDALATLKSLRQHLNRSDDPQIDLEESRSAEMAGDFRHSQEVAASAASKGIKQGARLIVAQARLDEGWDWDRLGEFDKAEQALTDARGLFTTAGDYRSAAVAINMMGDVLSDKGDYDSALKALNQSLAICREHGFQGCAARSLNAIGNIQNERGQGQQARASYEEVLRVNRDLGIQAGVGAALSNIANTLQDEGRFDDARKDQEESLKVYTEIGDKRGMAATLGNLGNLLDDMGDLPAAVQCYERAAKLDEEIGYKRGRGFVLTGWGNVLVEQGELDAAKSKLSEALQIRHELGNQGMIGDTMVSLARLSLGGGHPEDAEKFARDAASQFANVKQTEDEATANAILARALIARGQISEARAAVDLTSAYKGRDPRRKLDVGIAGAEVKAATGKGSESLADLDRAIARARESHLIAYELEARLARSKVLIASGQAGSAATTLSSLQQDASAKGYLLIARQAKAAQKR